MIHRTPFAHQTALKGSLLSVLLLLGSNTAMAEEITGQVVEVLNGDTLSLLTSDDWQIHVRLANIDAPNPSQPYSDKARQTLSALALGKRATLKVQARDMAGRSVAQVFIEGKDINREMVRRGAAWVAHDHAAPPVHLLPDEAAAKRERRGLWSQPKQDIVAPWVWSNTKQQGQQTMVSSCAGHSGTPACPVRRLNWVPQDERQPQH
ncbi:thermonuclease family protein [Azotobacter chroococcum]|uniref:Micrococcal nuclease (SNase-like) n=1 Tax=Azotobacter chroococcum NCIMB 8003 TaxID=1328314 RepID=A0A0C4WMH9_9GAMM|nr:thermonuclease family protein [Azotobacter chroococcum]AJE21561.1 Micrococcal nuclease (SNase-like) [Azotobacter chroococcum NCIMB 8003]